MDIRLAAELQNKLNKLEEYIKGLGSLAVAFSGGVDSSLLLYVAHKVLGDRAIAITGAFTSVPEREKKEAAEFCEKYGIPQVVFSIDQMKIDEFRQNGPERCYFCKLGIFSEIKRIAEEKGISFVAEGSNMDDMGDYRPGLKAIAELSVKSPLREAGLTKADIRAISKAFDLHIWSKPSYACLASRFVYGEEITEEKLRMIEQAEEFLIEHGFIEERVRLHGNLARIEVPAKDIEKLAKEELREEICKKFKEIGFSYMTLDMQGYRTGAMNEVL